MKLRELLEDMPFDSPEDEREWMGSYKKSLEDRLKAMPSDRSKLGLTKQLASVEARKIATELKVRPEDLTSEYVNAQLNAMQGEKNKIEELFWKHNSILKDVYDKGRVPKGYHDLGVLDPKYAKWKSVHRTTIKDGNEAIKKQLQRAGKRYYDIAHESGLLRKLKNLYDQIFALEQKMQASTQAAPAIDITKLPPKIQVRKTAIDNPAVTLNNGWAGHPAQYPKWSKQMTAMYRTFDDALTRNGYQGLTTLYGGENAYGTVFVAVGGNGRFIWYKKAAYMSTNYVYIGDEKLISSKFAALPVAKQDALLKKELGTPQNP